MATPVTASVFGGDVKDHVRARFHTGWAGHNRGTRGDGWGPVNGIMLHHFGPYATVAGAVAMGRSGHSTLPGPLYPILVEPGGLVNVVGWGRCNHAGMGDGDVLRAVRAEQYPLPRPNQADTDGNARFYGICLINRGNGESYPERQLQAAAVVAALLCRYHQGWTAKSVIGHKEWQPGKPDPSLPMDAFRGRVARYLASGIPDLRSRTAAAKAPAPAAPCRCCTTGS